MDGAVAFRKRPKKVLDGHLLCSRGGGIERRASRERMVVGRGEEKRRTTLDVDLVVLDEREARDELPVSLSAYAVLRASGFLGRAPRVKSSRTRRDK
jgi:hypothetical protein